MTFDNEGAHTHLSELANVRVKLVYVRVRASVRPSQVMWWPWWRLLDNCDCQAWEGKKER